MNCRNCGAELVEGARFCPKCGKAIKGMSSESDTFKTDSGTKKKHPVLAAFFMVLCILNLFTGFSSLLLRYTLSEAHIEKVMEKTKISELQMGEAVYEALVIVAETVDDENISDYLKKIDKNTTLTELITDAMGENTGDIGKKEIRNALDDKYFKRELTKLITDYLDDLLYDTGRGKADKNRLCNLLDAFEDGMGVKMDYGYYRSSLGREITQDMDDNELEQFSVSEMVKNTPIAVLRVFVSVPFVIGMVLFGAVFLIVAISINWKGWKKAGKTVLIVFIVEVLLLLSIILSGRVFGGMIVKRSVKSLDIGEIISEAAIEKDIIC